MHWWTLSPEEWTAIRLSLWVSSIAMLASLPFGIAIAVALARGRFWGKSLLNGIVHLPLILPPVVTGFLLLVLFGRRGQSGNFSIAGSASSFLSVGQEPRSPAPSWPFP